MNEVSEPAVVPRLLTASVQRALKAMPVVVVTGARQTGKSTLVRHLLGPREYLTLDDIEIQARAEREPDALVHRPGPLTLDEVQRTPALLHAIKKAVDERRSPGRFVLTGSADLLLMKRVSETLAGRAAHFTLLPMTRRERLGRGTAGPWSELFAAPAAKWIDVLAASDAPREDWRPLALSGGYPTPSHELADPEARALWFAGYTKTYLERDLRDLSAVASLVDFRRLMGALCLRIGGLVNQTEVGRDVGMPQPTVRRHLDLLEVSYQLVRVPAYAVNRTRRLIKTPKLYWSDTGLAMHLAGESEPRGPHLENLVLCDLLAWKGASPDGPSILYWRTAAGDEVDFVVESSDRVFPIEVKATSRPRLSDARSLAVFREEYGKRAGPALLVHSGDELAWLADGILACPFWRLL
jgi:predicted AAA+ superfamily ATPase